MPFFLQDSTGFGKLASGFRKLASQPSDYESHISEIGLAHNLRRADAGGLQEGFSAASACTADECGSSNAACAADSDCGEETGTGG